MVTLKRDGTTKLHFEGEPLASSTNGGLLTRRLTLYRTEQGTYILHVEESSRSGASLSDAYTADCALMVFFLIATDIGSLGESSNRELLRKAARLDPQIASLAADLAPELLTIEGEATAQSIPVAVL